MKKERIKKGKMGIQKSIIFILFCMITFIVLFMQQTKAVNETTNQTNNTNTNTSQNTVKQENTTNTATTVEKSSNTRLSNLGIRPHDFTGFRYGTTSYEVEVPEDTQTVEVYATAEDEKAKVTGTGKKTLEKGENRADVVVTAEDGTTRTYTIHIIRKTEQENQLNREEVTNTGEGKGLSKLKINNLSLLPEFKTDVFQYQVKYIGENTKLEIETEPTDKSYMVEVMGNENLQEGDNFITILVSEAEGTNVATYQITVNKSLVDVEAIAKEEKEKLQRTIIGAAVAVIVLISIVIGFIMIRKRNIRLEEEFSGRYSYDEEEENDMEEEEEIPKALRGKRFREEEPEKNWIINKGFDEKEEENTDQINEWEEKRSNLVEEEEDFERMPKEELKEKFLNNYNCQETNMDFDFEDSRYQNNRKKGKHKGKRFK